MNTRSASPSKGDPAHLLAPCEAPQEHAVPNYPTPSGRLVIRERPLPDENWSEIVSDDEYKE